MNDPQPLALELRELAARLDKVADRYAHVVLTIGDPSMQADARVFRQAAATARSAADEIDELKLRAQEMLEAKENPASTDA